jgi:hypothetical protein
VGKAREFVASGPQAQLGQAQAARGTPK